MLGEDGQQTECWILVALTVANSHACTLRALRAQLVEQLNCMDHVDTFIITWADNPSSTYSRSPCMIVLIS